MDGDRKSVFLQFFCHKFSVEARSDRGYQCDRNTELFDHGGHIIGTSAQSQRLAAWMDIFFSFRQVVDIYYDIHAGGTDNHDFFVQRIRMAL